MESTQLGTAKIYFNKEDFGKMLKLKDVGNLVINDIKVDKYTSGLEVTIITPMNNVTNERVRSKDENSIRREHYCNEVSQAKEDKELSDIYIRYEVREFNSLNLVMLFNGKKYNAFGYDINKCIERLTDKIRGCRWRNVCVESHGIGSSVADILEKEYKFKNVVRVK